MSRARSARAPARASSAEWRGRQHAFTDTKLSQETEMAITETTVSSEKKVGLPFYSPPPGVAPLPYGKPGPMTDTERYLFETTGLLIVPDALSPEETAACQAASERLHSNLEFVQNQHIMQAGGEPPDSIEEWQSGGLQQLDNAFEVRVEPLRSPQQSDRVTRCLPDTPICCAGGACIRSAHRSPKRHRESQGAVWRHVHPTLQLEHDGTRH